ncbi:GTP-binding protein 1 [Liparis tanakae]|uniref:Urotensin-2 receptor n=1 Tax=Liparis tanakae TaxID=230148 RepID=A0A4Z2EUM9_9TELE|nr:GTP-binding protein 1 [Liparis tanakae]
MNCSPNATAPPPLLLPPPPAGAPPPPSGAGGPWVTALLGATLTLMCALGVAGNAYTLAVTRSAALRRRGSMYVYIVNLALADLLYLSTIPFVVSTYVAHDWLFGEAGCRVLLSLDLLTMHASVFILAAMSLERYRAVARPFGARRSSARGRRLAAGAIWALAFALTLPMMVMIRLSEGKPGAAGAAPKRMCSPTWTPEAFRAYVTVLFLTSVLLPGLLIVALYAGLAGRYWAVQAGLAAAGGGGGGRSARRRGLKQKVVSMIFCIVVAYWACFLPFWGWQLAKLFSPDSLRAMSPAAHNYVNFFVTCLTYGNSCVNPFLYTLLTRNYKDYLAQRGHVPLHGMETLCDVTHGHGDMASLAAAEAAVESIVPACMFAPDRGCADDAAGAEGSEDGEDASGESADHLDLSSKLVLVSPTGQQYDALLRHLRRQVDEGCGETIYVIEADLIFLRERTEAGGRLRDYLIRRRVGEEDFLEVRVAVVGNVDAGKSTLLGVLTHGELDNGRGFARQKLFRHKHEMESGRTSSVGNDILGFDQEGQVSFCQDTQHGHGQVEDNQTN